MGAQSGLCGCFIGALRGPLDFTEGPKRQSKNDRRGNAGVLTEAEGKGISTVLLLVRSSLITTSTSPFSLILQTKTSKNLEWHHLVTVVSSCAL